MLRSKAELDVPSFTVLGVHHRVRYLKLNMSQYFYWRSVILRSAGCSEKYSLLLEVTPCQKLHTVRGFHLERRDVHSLEVPDSIWWMSLINLVNIQKILNCIHSTPTESLT